MLVSIWYHLAIYKLILSLYYPKSIDITGFLHEGKASKTYSHSITGSQY